MSQKKVELTDKPQVSMSLYDVNKQLFKQVPKDTNVVLNTAFASIGAWFSANWKDKFFTLMCREKYDFTTFHFVDRNFDYAKDQVKEVLESRGEILHIEFDDNNQTYQCWVKDKDDEVWMYLLFDSEFMAVEV